MNLLIDGTELNFVKASRSHIDGKECVHVAVEGATAFLVESDNPSFVVETPVRNLTVFFDGVKRGEFDHLVAGVLEPAV
ncbi:hypothetical protein [Saccharopolyspora mangrovi]|uniref:DUF397 domain-containing protein n=1 Tax=Saccharopolyspora mangrovi TaxID=3082379 RepID=A0ABU6A4V3_9PSEU|nr:hypothetical protein [Saccharopolyspora sp. S2-29]MEB3366609.1 hypothetical protein [Saccharopolyspora sp. S2-29]